MENKKQSVEEYVNNLYKEEVNSEMYTPDVYQSRVDFKAGFNLAEELFKPKWISVEEQTPEEGKSVIIKTFDYRRPKENVTDITLGYFEDGSWFYDNVGYVNEGNGWIIISYMEFPQ